MPSLRTRVAYQSIALQQAAEAVAQAAEQVQTATSTLSAIEEGTLDLDAVKIDGVRFVRNGNSLVAQP